MRKALSVLLIGAAALVGSHEFGNGSADPVFSTSATNGKAAVDVPVSIKSPPYNAVCDGVTDDHAAITAALNSGRPIFIPAFCYSSSSISVSGPALQVYGSGPATSGLIFGGTGGGVSFAESGGLVSWHAASMHDLAIYTRTNGGGTALSVACGADNMYVTIHHAFISGLNVGVHGWTTGIRLTGCDASWIHNNYIWGNQAAAIGGSVGVSIGGVTGRGSYQARVESNIIHSFDADVHVYGNDVEGVHVDNNYLAGNVAAVFDMSGSTGVPPGYFFRGNEVECSAGSGTLFGGACIQYRNIAQSIISDNIIYQGRSGAANLSVSGTQSQTANNFFVSNNFFTSIAPPVSGNTGVVLSGYVSVATIHDNTFQNLHLGLSEGSNVNNVTDSLNHFPGVPARYSDSGSYNIHEYQPIDTTHIDIGRNFSVDAATGGIAAGANLLTGRDLSTEDAYVSLGGLRTGAGNAIMNFCELKSSCDGRIARTNDANGNFDVELAGSGAIVFYTNGPSGKPGEGTIALTLDAGQNATVSGFVAAKKLVATAMPTGCAGQAPGTLWNDRGTVHVC